ncbi:hypothetical protein EYZ11_007774 [Aspergillus tanneri]|uniref:Uncharacterized protein n=1 Tax=Aspergillus tanneri TaxID=1220188 RepID=A0A4S3JC66_9EURO|nr:uncharacterized protein ATNIH1004_004158 [Aspergillus tanneri]KAA8648274.1 hypothetical protein ATNIH1004_004158 [Aspergillus tanneri]THC92756.1 hypothetical protein EYZ11_007774 [Aspergillus tanneri]
MAYAPMVPFRRPANLRYPHQSKGSSPCQRVQQLWLFSQRLLPDWYGFFTARPDVLDTVAALEDIPYAFDELQADGITLFTHYREGNHDLGLPAIKPIWEELHRQSGCLIRPTHPADTTTPVNKMLP